MALPAQVQNAKALLARFTLQQKIILGIAAVGVIVLVYAATYFSNRVNYQVLYTDLEPQEAQNIVQRLQTEKVPYQLSDDGRTIRIAAEKLSELRLKLASEGVPSSGRIGFEIFDQTSLGLTNFQEQVNYQRALEGELARSIMTLSEVEGARVHLVLARESLFQNAEDQAKASVVLKLKNGRSLSPGAVQGIVNVVASSVKGLTPERVTVIDLRGKVLSRPEPEGGLTGAQADMRQKLENEMGTKIVQILEPAVGVGKVRPQVAVNMNFEQVEETTERYDPNASVVRSQQKQDERQPGRDSAYGIPGPRGVQARQTPPPATSTAPAGSSGTPPAGTTVADSSNTSIRQSETINYEVSKAVRHTVEPVGRVNRISVAVLIDNRKKLSDDGKSHTSEPRTSQEMDKYREIIAAAVGFNQERGDRLTIENIGFEEESVSDVAPPMTFIERQAPLIMTGLRYLIIPLAFIVIYILFLRPIHRAVLAALAPAPAPATPKVGEFVKSLPRPDASGRFTPMTVKQLEAQLQAGQQHAGQSETAPPPFPGPSKTELIRNHVIQHAAENPEVVARMVRGWMSKREER